jgi:hypothetical protein
MVRPRVVECRTDCSVSRHTDTVDAYMDGFRRRDKQVIPAFCDVFTFRADLICRVESYIVPLTGPTIAELAGG